jgi:putative DNA primase/helicase
VPAVPGHRGWFHCFHCERRTQIEFREQLDVSLRDAGAKIVAAFEFDDVDPTQWAGKTSVGRAGGRALASYEATEDGLALAFAAEHEGRLRFDHLQQKWFVWTTPRGYWRRDQVAHAFHWSRELTRAFRATQETELRALAKIAVAGAVERAARADARLAVDGLGWDQNIWLAGTPAGTLDLKTGRIAVADPAHAITKQLLVAPRDQSTPLWDQFMWDSTGGDGDMICFLQSWFGYCLTGDVTEEKFVFIFGPGGNGKGTFLFTMNAILHDYAVRTPADTFMVRKHDAHPAEVARLMGARAVTATEIEEGRTFNVVRLKDFTGRDGKIAARFMFRDWFEFAAQFKVTFVGNHQPRLVNVDDAMRRRLVLVPFTQVPRVVNTTLKDSLVDEYPGILRWAIEGENLRRAMGGLSALIPPSAAAATRAYLDEQDLFRAWAEDRCVFGLGDQMTVNEGFEDYRLWCSNNDTHPVVGERQFSRKFLEAFPKCRYNKDSAGTRILEGVKLSPQNV